MGRNRNIYGAYLAIALILVPIWEMAARSSPRVRLLLSSPGRILEFSQSHSADLFHATLITGGEALAGMVLATVVSLLLIVIGMYFPRFLAFVLPATIASQVIPLIVLAPFFVIAFGIGMTSKVAMAAVLCFFPTFIGFSQGFRLISRETHDLLDVYDAKRTFRIYRVYLPLSLPSGMAGLKVSATLSVIGAIVAEFTGAEAGLGRNLFLSTIRLNPDLMMASLLAAAALGAVMFGLVHLAERILGKWYLTAGAP